MSTITEENQELYKEMYECFMNVDGTLQLKKLEKVLQCIGYNPTTEELADYTSTHSTCFENDGKIDFNEFLGIMEYVQKVSGIPGAQEYKLKEAFDYFDKDGSGYLEPEELRNLLIECGVDNPDDDDVEYLLEAADTNHDGKIALQESAKLLCSFKPRKKKREKCEPKTTF